MNLRSIKRRHDARTKRTLALWALYSGSNDEWYEDDDWDDDPCPHCFGYGTDPDCDHLMSCPLCGGCG